MENPLNPHTPVHTIDTDTDRNTHTHTLHMSARAPIHTHTHFFILAYPPPPIHTHTHTKVAKTHRVNYLTCRISGGKDRQTELIISRVVLQLAKTKLIISHVVFQVAKTDRVNCLTCRNPGDDRRRRHPGHPTGHHTLSPTDRWQTPPPVPPCWTGLPLDEYLLAEINT